MALTQQPRPRGRDRRRGQRGDVLLVTLVLMLVVLLGVVMALRQSLASQWLAGNNLTQQKDVHATDIALRVLEGQVTGISAGMPLEVAAAGQDWYRDVAPGTAAPTPAYWASCVGNSNAALRCSSFSVVANGTTLPYTAYAVVQPTGRSDSHSCSLAQYQAIYYDLIVRVQETGGATSATSQTVYRICTIA